MDAQVVYDGENWQDVMLIKPLVMNVLLEVRDGNDACVGSQMKKTGLDMVLLSKYTTQGWHSLQIDTPFTSGMYDNLWNDNYGDNDVVYAWVSWL